MTRAQTGQDFDPRIADWLEADPDHAPAIVLDTVLAAFPSIPQRRASRAPWRFPTMYRYALLGAAVVAIVAIGVGGFALGSGPTSPVPSPSLSPSPSPSSSPSSSAWPSYALPYSIDLTTRVSSPLYGYSIASDPSWTFTPATVPADDPASTDQTGTDHLAVTGSDTTIAILRTALAGKTFDAYLAEVRQGVIEDQSVPGSCKPPDPAEWETIPVGTQQGRIMLLCNFEAVYVDIGDVVYEFDWGHETFDGGRHLELLDFKTILTTVEFSDPSSSASTIPSP